MSSLQKETGDLATLDKEKAEVLNDFFASFFNSKCSSNTTQLKKDRENKDPEPFQV